MDLLKKTLILALIASIAAIVVTVIYLNTKPVIYAHNEAEFFRIQKSILKGALKFEEIIMQDELCYMGYDSAGRKTGLVLPVSSIGYGGKVEMMIGIDMAGIITGLRIINQNETPGLGSKIEKSSFISQFTELTEADIDLKKENPAGKIDAITAATISSRTVINGVKNGFNLYNNCINYTRKKEVLNRIAAGTYRGTGEGFSGQIVVEVVVAGNKITAIKIIRHQETEQYWTKVKSGIPGKILKSQNIEIDTVTGATITSQGLIDAIHNAIEAGEEAGDSPPPMSP